MANEREREPGEQRLCVREGAQGSRDQEAQRRPGAVRAVLKLGTRVCSMGAPHHSYRLVRKALRAHKVVPRRHSNVWWVVWR